MKIHFIASAIGNKNDYGSIIDLVEKLGNTIITRHAIERSREQILSESPEESELYVKKFQTWHKKADVVIFEVTTPDISIGYEIAYALTLSKPVIVLYRRDINSQPGTPGALKGMHSERLQVLSYDDATLGEILALALDYAEETSDIRFNFFVTPTISAYLDWIAKERKLPRSVYLRRLIEDDMNSNLEYDGRDAALQES
mgnify:CR=1 FL=1